MASTFASESTETDASAQQPCDVCRAKQFGGKVPRRKCSCSSGLTAQRDRACDRAKERQHREANWQEPCRDGLMDRLEAIDFTTLPPHDFDEWITHYEWSAQQTGKTIEAYLHPRTLADWEVFEAALTDWGRFVRLLKAAVGHERSCADGNVDMLRNLINSSDFARFKHEHERSLSIQLNELFGDICREGSVAAASVLLQAGVTVTDLTTDYDAIDFDDGFSEIIPRAAQPLYCAASAGNATMVTWLLQQKADPNAPASDGTTPFYAACAEGHVDVLCILRDCGADMTAVDQDGTSPALIATARGCIHACSRLRHLRRVKVLKMLHESGVDLHAPSHIYEDGYTVLRRNVTPLTLAREDDDAEVVAYLESLVPERAKRVRSSEPMLERAARVGVADRLKPIPTSLIEATRAGSGTAEQIQAAKKQLKALQTANAQIVDRAEKARLKQTKLVV